MNESVSLSSTFGIPTPVRDNRESYQKRRAIIHILCSILFERIAFYTLAANLALGLDVDKQPYWKVGEPSIQTFIFTGVSNISTLIFAVISDRKFGRIKIILFGFVLYIIGYILITLFTTPPIHVCAVNMNITYMGNIMNENSCSYLKLAILILIATGAGAVQSCLIVFGVEQIQESKKTSRFFEKYVIIVNTSAIIAMFAFPRIYEDNSLYYIAYPLATLSLLIGALIFIVGQRYYIHIKPFDSVLSNCIPVIICAFRTWYKYRLNSSKINSTNSSSPLLQREFIHEQETQPKFLDFAKAENHGIYPDRIVDDVKSLGNAIVVFTLLIPYWLIFNQLNSTFRQQAQAMYRVDKNSLTIVSLIDPITIIIGILFLIKIVYKYVIFRTWLLTLLTKFIVGMCFAVITMILAGFVELAQRNNWRKDSEFSNVSIYLQIPQGIIMGLSELFIMVASYEYAYFSAPVSGQSLFMSLRFCSIGLSSIIGVGYIYVYSTDSFQLDFKSCQESEVRWPFYCYFFILAFVQVIFIVIFILCQKKYRIVKFNRQQIEINQNFQHPVI